MFVITKSLFVFSCHESFEFSNYRDYKISLYGFLSRMFLKSASVTKYSCDSCDLWSKNHFRGICGTIVFSRIADSSIFPYSRST